VLAGVADADEVELLLPAGYAFYLVGAGALLPRSKIEPSERFRDWLFTPRPREELASLGIRVGEPGGR
jgi:hypothetical protein